jgi:tetratricopeptide (TPR) repeat protein
LVRPYKAGSEYALTGEKKDLTMAQTAKTATAPKRPPRTIAGAVSPADDPARAHVLGNYEGAIRLMQEGKYDKARSAFDKLLTSGAGDLAERVRMYINACEAQASKGKTAFSNCEEQYDYAVSLLNDGNYEDAREQFQIILQQNEGADYAFYGLAVLSSMTGDSQTCLEHLTEAIRRNPRNRIQARSDSDFQDMADDPRFTELLYPEV